MFVFPPNQPPPPLFTAIFAAPANVSLVLPAAAQPQPAFDVDAQQASDNPAFRTRPSEGYAGPGPGVSVPPFGGNLRKRLKPVQFQDRLPAKVIEVREKNMTTNANETVPRCLKMLADGICLDVPDYPE